MWTLKLYDKIEYFFFSTVLKGENPAPVHSRPTFNDDPPEASDDTDGKLIKP